MTRSENSYSPRKLKLDKENVHNPTKRGTNTSGSSPYKSPLKSPVVRRSPPGSSKLLREHFANMDVAQPNRRRRLMDSGPVRLIRSARNFNTPTKSRRRVGIDGTHLTPSKELLKSTTASRNQRTQYCHDDSSSTDQSFGSFSYEELSSPRRTPPRRMECMDPVAFTLLKGGDEDTAWLLEQDRSFVVTPKLTSNLTDIYGDNSREMARPIPVIARRLP